MKQRDCDEIRVYKEKGRINGQVRDSSAAVLNLNFERELELEG